MVAVCLPCVQTGCSNRAGARPLMLRSVPAEKALTHWPKTCGIFQIPGTIVAAYLPCVQTGCSNRAGEGWFSSS